MSAIDIDLPLEMADLENLNDWRPDLRAAVVSLLENSDYPRVTDFFLDEAGCYSQSEDSVEDHVASMVERLSPSDVLAERDYTRTYIRTVTMDSPVAVIGAAVQWNPELRDRLADWTEARTDGGDWPLFFRVAGLLGHTEVLPVVAAMTRQSWDWDNTSSTILCLAELVQPSALTQAWSRAQAELERSGSTNAKWVRS